LDERSEQRAEGVLAPARLIVHRVRLVIEEGHATLRPGSEAPDVDHGLPTRSSRIDEPLDAPGLRLTLVPPGSPTVISPTASRALASKRLHLGDVGEGPDRGVEVVGDRVREVLLLQSQAVRSRRMTTQPLSRAAARYSFRQHGLADAAQTAEATLRRLSGKSRR